MKKNSILIGMLTILVTLSVFFPNFYLFLENVRISCLVAIPFTIIVIIYFLVVVQTLRRYNPGKFVMTTTWTGLIIQCLALVLVIIGAVSEVGIAAPMTMMVQFFNISVFPCVSIASGSIAGKEHRSWGALFATISGFLWILSLFWVFSFYLTLGTLTLLGVMLIIKPIESDRITRWRPSDKTIKLSLLIGAILMFTLPYPITNLIEVYPQFITHDWIELSKIEMISKFRSQAGHAYNDIYESLSSQKHYFEPDDPYKNTIDQIEIYCPVSGVVTEIFYEGHVVDGKVRGYQVWIKPFLAPLYKVVLFHVIPLPFLYIGKDLSAGQWIGYADCGSGGNVDITIHLVIPILGVKFISYFSVMTDEVFSYYQARGISTRDQMIIPRSIADQYTIYQLDILRDWVNLTSV